VFRVPGSDQIARNLDAWFERVRAALFALAQEHAREAEGWMKENAPWTDRTGNARQGLKATVSMEEAEIRITLSHTVDYGVYLELRQGPGRRPILAPARERQAPLLLEDVKALLG